MQAADYARIVRDLAMRRHLISILTDIIGHAYDAKPEETAETLFAHAEASMEEVRPALGAEASEFQSFGDVSVTSLDRMSSDWQNHGRPRGLTTGYPKIDEKIGGLEAPDLIILGGRPGMGKTSLATNIAVNAAKALQARRAAGERTGVVGFFSLEMSKSQLVDRALSTESGVPSWRIRKRDFSEAEFGRIFEKQREMQALPLDIDETGGLSIDRLKAKARALKKRRGLELLVVDYLQLVRGSNERRRDGNRTQEVSDVSAGLKELAKELQIPIVALSQVSRQVEARDDPRPQMSDLRESGSIEQDADMILFVFREVVYTKNRRPEEGTERFTEWERRMALQAPLAESSSPSSATGPPARSTWGSTPRPPPSSTTRRRRRSARRRPGRRSRRSRGSPPTQRSSTASSARSRCTRRSPSPRAAARRSQAAGRRPPDQARHGDPGFRQRHDAGRGRSKQDQDQVPRCL